MFPRASITVDESPRRSYEVVGVASKCMGFDAITQARVRAAVFDAKAKCERDLPSYPWAMFSEAAAAAPGATTMFLPTALSLPAAEMAAWRRETASRFRAHLQAADIRDVFGRPVDIRAA